MNNNWVNAIKSFKMNYNKVKQIRIQINWIKLNEIEFPSLRRSINILIDFK